MIMKKKERQKIKQTFMGELCVNLIFSMSQSQCTGLCYPPSPVLNIFMAVRCAMAPSSTQFDINLSCHRLSQSHLLEENTSNQILFSVLGSFLDFSLVFSVACLELSAILFTMPTTWLCMVAIISSLCHYGFFPMGIFLMPTSKFQV